MSSPNSPYLPLHPSGQSFDHTDASTSSDDDTPGLIGGIKNSITATTRNATQATLQVTTNALMSAGSATSSYILQPTAQVVARDVLPELWSLLWEYVKEVTPQRGRDVARIFGSGGSNLLNIVGGTEQGEKFLRNAEEAGDYLLDALSSPAGREWVVEVTASAVKTAEAFAAPESKAALEAWVTALTKWTSLLASPTAHAFYASLGTAVWSGARLAADEKSVLGVAEVRGGEGGGQTRALPARGGVPKAK